MPSEKYLYNKPYSLKYISKNRDKTRVLNRNNKRRFDTFARIKKTFLNILIDV